MSKRRTKVVSTCQTTLASPRPAGRQKSLYNGVINKRFIGKAKKSNDPSLAYGLISSTKKAKRKRRTKQLDKTTGGGTSTRTEEARKYNQTNKREGPYDSGKCEL